MTNLQPLPAARKKNQAARILDHIWYILIQINFAATRNNLWGYLTISGRWNKQKKKGCATRTPNPNRETNR
jgi:hypothetical protein